jgi:eukaryotic-like serine/threonine-protein kinase
MSSPTTRVYSGRYELVRRIARGGMAEVYLARDLLLDRHVALKMLFPELSVDEAFVARFRREAQAAANLSHPNIVSVYDWGEGDGAYFIVMEYVDGRPLSSHIRAEGALLPDRAAAVGAAVASALAFAHRAGVIHRDVKPGNVLITSEGHVKVADFGIARATSAAQEDLTQTGAVMGTATYFSPEQAQGLPVDPRTDLYSLGVVLYEMVTGQPPFSGDNAVAIAYQHVRETAVPPRQVNPALPQAFEDIVLMAMAKDPGDRYQTADELRADLLRYRQGRPVLARPPTPTQALSATEAVAAAPGPANEVLGPVGGAPTRAGPAIAVSEERPTRPRTGAYIVLLILMLALLGGLLYLLGRSLGYFHSGSSAPVAVPSVIGLPADQAGTALRAQGFKVTTDQQNSDATANTVFDQDPKAGAKAAKGSTVTIRVSKGQGTAPVPDVVGKATSDAANALRSAGFQVSTQAQPDDRVPRDHVISQDPTAGSATAKNSTVRLTVSSGKSQVPVPDVTGQPEPQAANLLGQAGLQVGTVTQQASDTVPSGRVISTNPAPNTQVEKGSSVALVVSSGSASPQVPNVVGLTAADARSTLQGAGFKVTTQTQIDPNPADNGRVIDQSPTGGSTAPSGSTVTIVVARTPGSSTTGP